MSGGKILSEVAVEREIVLIGKVCVCVCVGGGGGGGGEKGGKREDEKARENIEKRACNR